MFMTPPTLVSLPLKLMLFVAVDGWALVSSGLVTGVTGGTVP
jgi:flagellar biosynthetic protein FliP